MPALAPILPKMFVDDNTMNIVGKRTDGSTRSELIVRVYASPTSTSFTLYEDDGATTSYTTAQPAPPRFRSRRPSAPARP